MQPKPQHALSNQTSGLPAMVGIQTYPKLVMYLTGLAMIEHFLLMFTFWVTLHKKWDGRSVLIITGALLSHFTRHPFLCIRRSLLVVWITYWSALALPDGNFSRSDAFWQLLGTHGHDGYHTGQDSSLLEDLASWMSDWRKIDGTISSRPFEAYATRHLPPFHKCYIIDLDIFASLHYNLYTSSTMDLDNQTIPSHSSSSTTPKQMSLC
jgi:hypothetical protein